MNMQKLIKFIESHGHIVLAHADATITVRAVYMKRGVGCKVVVETINATRQAVRDWLGY